MTDELIPTAKPAFFATLAEAAATFRSQRSDRPSAKAVVNALLQAEKAAKQQRLVYSLESLLGDWRLCFTTAGKAHLQADMAVGKGFYLPQIAKAQITFSTTEPVTAQASGKAEISNQIQFGSLLLKLTGPAQYLGKKNLLFFDFTQMQLLLFSRTVYSGQFRGGKATAKDFYQQSMTQLPFFAFFLIAEDFIAARGRGGGIAVWAKEI